MTDKRYTKDGDYLSKAAVLDLNERHGWLAYGDAQSDASNAFANNAVHSFLESAKQAQEVLGETGLTPRQLVVQRDALVHALEAMTGFCDEHADFRNGVTDPTGSIDEGNVRASEYFSIARAALALVKGEPK